MTDITELTLTGGGSATVATDEMLADVESLAAIAAGLEIVLMQLSIADATLSDQSRAMTQVGWARAAMDDAWTATTNAKGVSTYLGGRLVTAIENYTETEHNTEMLAMGVDTVLSFLAGSYLGSLPREVQDWLATRLPWIVRDGFDDQGEPIGAHDASIPDALNRALLDEHTIAMIRRLVMTGEAFTTGLGDVPPEMRQQLESMGVSGASFSGALLMLYAQQAGMFTETDVSVTKRNSYERSAPVDGVAGLIRAIPDAELRGDGAQIRIDEIHDGSAVRYEVFIAGTADFTPISRDEPWDLTSNVAGVAGQSPASYRAVQQAMQQAGITSATEVSFVGYSQGGLIASMLTASGDYNTKGLVTIGGPSGQIIIPPGVPALLIEHYEDLIPALGGTQANTDALVVRRHAFSDSHPADLSLPLPGHQLQYYLETASLIDDAESSLLRGTVDQITDFSAGDRVISTWYSAERVP
jgi:hypothetical protein